MLHILKEPRHYNRTYFCARHNNRRKFTLWYIKLNPFIWKIKFASHKLYLFGLLFSRNGKKTQTDQITTQVFLLCLNKTSHNPSKIATTKNFFRSVYVSGTACFDECLLFHVIIGRNYFYTNLSLPRGFLQPPYCCILCSKCFERSPYFMSVISTIPLQCC